MTYLNKKLQLRQLDEQLKSAYKFAIDKTPSGWIKAIRTGISMRSTQLAKRLNVSQQAISKLEKSEMEETISIGKLREVGNSLGLKLVYYFIPEVTLEKMVEDRALKLAKEIVLRTSMQMEIENQKIHDKKLNHSIQERLNEIMRTLPSSLWD